MVRQIERDRYDQQVVQAKFTEQAVARVMIRVNSTTRVWLPPWQSWDELRAEEFIAALPPEQRVERLPWKRRNLPPDLLAYLERVGGEA